MNPIAEAARYHMPTTFSRNVYTSSVSSVLDTPTSANFMNWTISGELDSRSLSTRDFARCWMRLEDHRVQDER